MSIAVLLHYVVLFSAYAVLWFLCLFCLLPVGLGAERDPYTGAPLSVSPLTWSHAGYVSAVHAFLRARDRLKRDGQLNGFHPSTVPSLNGFGPVGVTTAEVAR